MPSLREGQLNKRVRQDFGGGVNNYLGPRQVKDNESPEALDCDFKGKSGVGNREGYTQVGTVADSRTEIWGISEYHTSSLNQLVKFASNGSNVALYYSTNGTGTWTAVTGTTFTDNTNMDVVQAISTTTSPYVGGDGTLFSFNGTDTMVKYNGSSWASHTGAATLLYGALYDNRLWGVDPTYKDTLKFSTKTPDATKPFDFTANGTSSDKGTVTFRPGSGENIVGIKSFKNYLYVFLQNAIFRLSPASSANTFTVELVTSAVGCVSHRSITQVEEDLLFAGNDGIYSLGEVANYTSIRTTNKSLRVQGIFDAFTGADKQKLVGGYHNFKYHLFYPEFGGENTTCAVYDVRYKGWQIWTNIAAQAVVVHENTNGVSGLYFGEPSTGKVHKMYGATTDDGTAISSSWKSASFDEANPDVLKLFMHSTFVFGDLGGSVTVKVIFDDSETSATQAITQQKPQGGFGRDRFGRMSFGDATNTITVTRYINQPLRLKAKGKKFAVQYQITSTGQWRLDGITQTMIVFGHYKFPASLKLN